MGLNIKIFKISNIEFDKGTDREYTKDKELEEYTDFDSLRHSGDDDFIFSDALDWDEVILEEDLDADEMLLDLIYQRPEDIDQAKKWIEENIEKELQKRLLDLMEVLEKDKDLYLLALI